jgi:hypothetical protein
MLLDLSKFAHSFNPICIELFYLAPGTTSWTMGFDIAFREAEQRFLLLFPEKEEYYHSD